MWRDIRTYFTQHNKYLLKYMNVQRDWSNFAEVLLVQCIKFYNSCLPFQFYIPSPLTYLSVNQSVETTKIGELQQNLGREKCEKLLGTGLDE